MWSNGALVFMVLIQRAITTTEPRPGISAREQAARLAAVLPAPLKRRPERMNKYSSIILQRMRQIGW